MTTVSSRNAALLALAASAVLAWAPYVRLLAYPFRLLSTTVHELGHGLAALITGGSFLNYIVRSDGSGLATTAGGWRLVVIPAGYLSVTLFAALLLRLGSRPRIARRCLLVVGALMVLLSLRFALPSLFRGELASGTLSLVAGLGLGAALLWIGLEASPAVAHFTLYLVAFQAGLSAFTDLWTLIGLSSERGVQTDAHAMAEILLLPPIVWALLWALLSVAILWLVLGDQLRRATASTDEGARVQHE